MVTVRDRNNPARGFTLIEILVIASLAISTKLGMDYIGPWIGGRFGRMWGGVIGFLLIPGVFSIYGLFITLVRDGIPWLPLCRNGCCRRADYELRRFDNEFYWVCKCGDRYMRRGRDFLQVTELGEWIVCRTWRPLRGWHPAGALPRAE